MSLFDLFSAIKEENLTRDRLEAYEQQLSVLYAEYMLRIATLKKSRAMYFYAKEVEHPELPDVKIRRLFEVTDEGQELIQKEAEVKAVSRMLSSIKSRIYQQY
jgi:hypothetical protein